jgi:hypothetical protein
MSQGARLAALVLLLVAPHALAGEVIAREMPAEDARYCGTPQRDAEGRIVRNTAVLRAFELMWPRPKDGRTWIRDHVIPLACGGCDSIDNLQWLPVEAWREKSKWERKVYGGKGISAGCP